MTLRTLQDWTVRPALLRVPGVADVVSYGGLVEEIHVEPDPTKMAALGIVLDDMFTALGKASANASGGLVQRGEQGFVIRSIGTFKSTRRHRRCSRRLSTTACRSSCRRTSGAS